jgi:hypothetical protein
MNKINAYFLAERNESLVFIVIGAAAFICSFYFWFVINERFYNGVAWPLIFIAFIQLTVGTIVYFRSPKDSRRVQNFVTTLPKNIKAVEIPRMEKVMTSFKLYRYIEISLLVIGLIVFILTSSGGFWRGVSFGLIIQSGIMLLADHFAESRGQRYLEYLKEAF